VSDAKRLRQLEAENSRLKPLLAEAHLDSAALKELLAKNWCGVHGSAALRHLVEAHQSSEQRACDPVGLARSVARDRPRRRDNGSARSPRGRGDRALAAALQPRAAARCTRL
jgi:hypothetical protein